MSEAGEQATASPPRAEALQLILEWLRDYPGGAALSPRFKSAFQVALAMVITYGISMAMDWDKAFWAALSVIFCSLATAGQSISASIDRVAGTVAACVVALLLMALFPQDRWLFLIGLSATIAVCSYRMTGPSRRVSVWLNLGFNLPIVALLGESGVELSPATFDMAILRAQQTAMGALVYSLVAMLVWPRRGDQDFIDTVRGLCTAQHELLRALDSRLTGSGDSGDAQKLAAQVAGQLPTLGTSLEGAAYDSGDIDRMKGAWASHLHTMTALYSALERWGDGFEELKGVDVKRCIPAWEPFMEEIELGFRGVDGLLSGQAEAQAPQAPALPLDEAALTELSNMQRASVVCCRDRLLAIAGLVTALFDSARSIARDEPVEFKRRAPTPADRPWVIDLDRLSTTVRLTSALWLAFLLIIYIEAVPIPVAIIAMTTGLGMALGQLPQVPAIILYRPIILGGMLGGAFYMFLLPQLSQFWQFGLCLFAVTFAIAYIFHEPQAFLYRVLCMTMLVLIMLADNQTNYSFLQFSSWMMVGVTFVTLLVVAWRFPISFRAEDRFQAQFRRYWGSAAFLLRKLDTQGRKGFVHRWQHAFHAHQLESLPPRLSVWAAALPPPALADSDRQHLQVLLQSLRLFSQRMSDLASSYADPTKLDIIRPLHSRTGTLRLDMAALAEQISRDPAAFSQTYRFEDMDQAAVDMRQWVEEELGATGIALDEAQRVYAFLGAYRGLAGVFREAVKAVVHIDWQRLGEARF